MNNENPNYYSIIPSNVRYDKRLLASEKIFYSEITALCNAYGFCNASNNYFVKLYETSTKTISTWLKHLSDYDYIIIKINKEKGNQRKIYLNAKDILTDEEIELKDHKTKIVKDFVKNIKR